MLQVILSDSTPRNCSLLTDLVYFHYHYILQSLKTKGLGPVCVGEQVCIQYMVQAGLKIQGPSHML